ncbi:SAM-dependent methyltransferase [Lysobacter niastensis]|uniref:SAM-dependent methyltransferase n=1 Tax=Lysobacter niastensis TaxID=380629 RepID=A0ABS0B7P9_9GAMM|nr:SAM-dependent methyltransferase [Lysobacter niastensis]MBF6023024.1 SAM-dependent methyltransferase [Lysobacter niastensis]
MGKPRPWPLAVAIALVSAAALAYQLLLMRWLAIEHWHPFAVMIISLALLGHGASGTWLSLWLGRTRSRLDTVFDSAFATCALLFGLTATLVPMLAHWIPFNGLELAWDPRQLLWLSALYLLLSVPFFFAACCFGLAFARHGSRIPVLYGADLIGAGAGALAALALTWLPEGRGLVLASLCAPCAAMLVAQRRRLQFAAVVVAALLVLLLPGQLTAPRANEYKGLSKTLLLPQARVLARRSGPYGSLAVLESPRVPLRHAPGLSLGYALEPPMQLGLYTDGDAMSVIVHDDGTACAREWLGVMTSALPYRMRAPRSVLVLGAGGGLDVLQALQMGAAQVDAVELDPQRLHLVRDIYAGYSGNLYRDRRVRAIVAEPRAYVRATPRRYDLIVLGGGDSFASTGAGVQAASEQYALTVEAMHDYLDRLTPQGMVVVTRWNKQPPRDELKLFATAIEALRERGVRDPARYLAAIRNWDASTWVIAREPLDANALSGLRTFIDERGFDPVHVSGYRMPAADRFHVLEPPTLYEGVDALLAPKAREYVRDYKFEIAPATDDRPYFGHFFRWRSLPELWRLREQGSAVLMDSGYLLLVAALVQALPIALLLVLLPLRALPRGDGAAAEGAWAPSRWRAASYFLALGLAFLFIEIATLSRLTLLVGHPLLAVNAGLAAFLLCAGLGSLQAQRWLGREGPAEEAATSDAGIARRIRWAVHVIAFGLLWQFAMFHVALEFAAAWPVWARALLGLAGIAPLAFAMGMPFPLGLARLARSAPALVPWAWGINGCASVIAAIAALLLSMAFGLRATLLIALALYVFAAWVWRGGQYRSSGSTSSDQRTLRASGNA